jgi:hypothetical protein
MWLVRELKWPDGSSTLGRMLVATPVLQPLSRMVMHGAGTRTQFALVMQHDAQERSIDLNPAVVPDEAQLLEFVHEQIDARPRCANHLGQRFLRYLWEHSLRPVLLSVSSKQQKSACEPLLG